MIQELIAAVLVAVISFAPGIALAFALLYGIELSKIEKLVFGIILALIVVPSLCFLEYLALGLLFNSALVFANSLLVFLIALALLYRQKQLTTLPRLGFKIEWTKEWFEAWIKENWVVVILVLTIILGFYIRFAGSWSTSFFEFDPYYYDKLTEKLVRQGAIPLFTQESYYPNQAFQRWAPLMHYLTGSWYALYQSILGGGYSQNALILTAQLYTPIVGALLSFLAFILVREEYNKVIALIPALLFAVTPQLIKKFAAGVNEQQPFGIFLALLVFALVVLAINRKSLRLALFASLACFAAVLGSQQYVWPFVVLGAYFFIQAVLDFLSGEANERLLLMNAVTVAGALAGNIVFSLYQQGAMTPLVTSSVLLLLASLVFSAALVALTRFASLTKFKERVYWLAGVVVIMGIASAFTPIGSMTVGYAVGMSSFAGVGAPIGMTVQEEGKTNESFFASSYGVLNPPTLLQAAAILAVISMLLYLLLKKQKNYAIAGAAIFSALIVFNAQVDGVLTWFASGTGNAMLVGAIQFFSENDVFLYMLIALIATSVSYLYAEKKNRTALLFVLIIFPVAYIGLNKLKYMLHLAFALCLALPFVLGEVMRALENLNEWLKITGARFVSLAALAGVMAIGLVMVFLQAQTVGASMNELAGTTINNDWIDAYTWIRENTPQDARILSWWDYGHWTTFFGERATVIDPNNAFPNFDQEVAQAFVNGEINDLYYVMGFHKATYVLADADLVSKWGALVYLSGTCNKNMSPVCPETPAIEDWRAGAGKSKYEAEHYFEYLTVVGQCPLTVSPVALPALSSSFGATYCLGKDEMFLLTRTGLDPNYKRLYKIVGRDQISGLDQNVSYLFAVSQNQFINVNPDLSYAGLNNNVFNAAFTRFFFFESLPGFKLAYRSPGGVVKIFQYIGPASVPTPTTPTPTPTPSPALNPTPSPASTLEPSPTVPASESNASNASTGNASNASNAS